MEELLAARASMPAERRIAQLASRAKFDMKDIVWLQWSSYKMSEWTGASVVISDLKGGIAPGPSYTRALDTLWLIDQIHALKAQVERMGV